MRTRRPGYTISALAFFLACSLAAEASPIYLTFRVDAVQGSSGINPASYIGVEYIVQAELDEFLKRGSYTAASGTTITLSDTPTTDFFYVEPIESNYVSLNDNYSYFASSPVDYHYGAWTIFSSVMWNVYGSGPTYGAFSYLTRVSLVTEGFDDMVAIDGFWPDPLALSSASSLLTPNAIWRIYDRDFYPNGSEVFGGFWASLTSVSEDPPGAVQIDEPSGLVLLVAGLAALGAVRLRRKR